MSYNIEEIRQRIHDKNLTLIKTYNLSSKDGITGDILDILDLMEDLAHYIQEELDITYKGP